MLTLLDRAQIVWFQRFLQADRMALPFDLYHWAIPRSEWDCYPNLALVKWPCA